MLCLEKAADLFPICDVVAVILGEDFLDELIILRSCNNIQISVTAYIDAHDIVRVDFCPLGLGHEYTEAATHQMNHGPKHPHHKGPSP